MLHWHRVGTSLFWRLSELVFMHGRPVAVPDWIDLAGVRTPLYVCELDAAKLRPTARATYRYDDETIDPRFAPAL